MTNRPLFGTDGIRGTANRYPMTADIALKVGMAAGKYFTRGSHRHSVVIGKDTRLSGYLIEPALTSGFIAAGMDVFLVGPMPTPAVAMLTRSLRADIGVMISASHNPYVDNGIKLFSPNGLKLSDEVEKHIEAYIHDDPEKLMVSSESLGRAKRLDDAPGRYIEYVKQTFPKSHTLDGMKIVIDCANGAAYHLGPKILHELGAEVIPLGVEPNGLNINNHCGSTYPKLLCAEVIKHEADLGIALDGDADRVLLCDEQGQVIDGDQILALIAIYWKSLGKLAGNGVVATDMSNLGLEHFLKEQAIDLVRAGIGDRYVAEAMRKGKYNIGGEQSGHIIISDYTTTGDGLIAALQVLATIVEQQKKASEVCRVFKPFPQLLRNVSYQGKREHLLNASSVTEAMDASTQKLAGGGRLFIRASGTEPVIRIMVEGKDERLVHDVADHMVNTIEKEALKH